MGDFAFQRMFLKEHGRPKTESQAAELFKKALLAAYTFIDNNPIGQIDFLGLENVQVVITTVIRPPDAEAGVKTRHSVTINEYGQIVDVTQFTGSTVIWGHSFVGISTFGQSVGGTHPNFTITMTVTSHSALLAPEFDIDYNFDIHLNYCERTGVLAGIHDDYPSYTVQVNGNNVFDWQQRGGVGNLFGRGDWEVEEHFNW